MILGTAGHIDHGKTTLIKALTGVDTDRLKEEKERGISIDIGFAHLDSGDGCIGVVDVPGHERFVRNMLAGAHGFDLVLLVVAADDGVMPQTEEHVDILHLLGVRRGVVALTKIDLVNAERRAAVREEIEILLEGTTLAGAPVVEVSPVTGEGLEHLRATILRQARQEGEREARGYFRLPIDRAFLLRGHGLVVTGTAIGGVVEAGAPVRILPAGTEARVRAIQIHGRPVTHARCGQRVALNLAAAGPLRVTRGDVVCEPCLDRATTRFDAYVELRPAARRPLKRHSWVRVHLGTAEVMARVVWLDGREALAPEASTYAQIELRESVVALNGDRFVLRDSSARITLGGGTVLAPFATRREKRCVSRLAMLETAHRAADGGTRVSALLAGEACFAVPAERLALAANLRLEEVRLLLAGHAGIRSLPDSGLAEAYTNEEKWARLCEAVRALLERFHRDHPGQPGLEMESLRSRLLAGLPAKVFRAIVAQLEAEHVVVRHQSALRLPDHAGEMDSNDRRLAEALVELLENEAFTPPGMHETAARLGTDPRHIKELYIRLEREGRVIRVAPDLYYAASAVANVRELVRRHIAEQGQITASQLRDRLQATRKFSLALLNYFDRTGFTVRVGDVRKLRGA